MQSERMNDNSMIAVKTRCRVIGVINCITFSVFTLIMITASIVILFSKEEEYFPVTDDDKLPRKFIFIVYITLIILISLAFLYPNYKLMQQYTPSDGRKIKLWLYAQIALSVYIVITAVISSQYYHHHCYVHTILYIVTITILNAELYIVNDFKNQIESGVVNQPSSA